MLTQEQIDSFHKNGYLIMRGLLAGRELAMLQEAAEQVKNEGIAGTSDHHLHHVYEDGRRVYWRSEYMWQRGDIFQAVTVNPTLLENIGQCLGEPFFPWNDSLVVKLAGEGAPVPWHQDPPYGTPYGENRETTFAVPAFTTDIYLDYSGPDNGGVWAIHGHHLVGSVDLHGKTQEELEEYGAVPLELEAGDVMFHCLSTPHGSRPNLSDKQRRILYLAYLSTASHQDAYGHMPWAQSRPAWSLEKEKQIEKMIEVRRAMGWATPESSPHLKLGDNGIEFTGTPVTPHRYWEDLARQIPETERRAKKELQVLSPSR